MILLGVVSAALSAYSPCELKYRTTNPTISYVLNDWCAIVDTVNTVDLLAAPFKPARAVALLANGTMCPYVASKHSRPLAESEFMTNVCAPRDGRRFDRLSTVIASKCLPPIITPQYLQTCTDLIAEARLHWCSCGMGGKECTNWQIHPEHFNLECPIGMKDQSFWRVRYVACKTTVDDWTARKLLYANTQSPLDILRLMTDCAGRFSVYFNYTKAYYTAENNRVYNHPVAVRSLNMQCLLAPQYTNTYANAALSKLVLQWNQQWCRDLF